MIYMPYVASLKTCSWEPLGFFGNLFWEPCLPSLGTLLGNCLGLLTGTFANLAWEPRLGTRSWEPLERGFLGTFANLAWEPFLGTLGTWLGNFAWKPAWEFGLEPALRNHAWEPSWEPLLGNLFLTLLWNLLGGLPWEPVPENLWESWGTCAREPLEIFGILFLATLLALLGNLCEPCLGRLLGYPLFERNLCDPCLGTSSWESLGTSWTLLRNLCEPCLGRLLGYPLLGTFVNFRERNLCDPPLLGNLWEPPEPCLGTLPANLFLGIFGNLLNLA